MTIDEGAPVVEQPSRRCEVQEVSRNLESEGFASIVCGDKAAWGPLGPDAGADRRYSPPGRSKWHPIWPWA